LVVETDISHLSDPATPINEEGKKQLEELASRYPWSEQVQVLYLKSLKDTNDVRFSKTLGKVALQCQDRSVLFKYLYSSDIQKTIDKVESEMAALPELSGLIPEDWKRSKGLITPENKVLEEAKIPAIKIESDEHLGDSTSDIKSNEKKESLPTGSDIETNNASLTLPKINLIQPNSATAEHGSDLNNNEEELAISAPETESGNEDSERKEVDLEQIDLSESGSEDIEIRESEVEPDTESLVAKDDDRKSKDSSNALSELNQTIISEAVDTVMEKEVMEFKSDLEEQISAKDLDSVDHNKDTSFLSSDDFVNWLVNKANKVEYPGFKEEKSVKASADDIITRFILNEPQIARGKAKDYDNGNLAADSLVDNEEFITETLAEIYANQGNISKAKRAFQLLSLKYPEKSIYFAARIKQLGRKK